jgi:hypothetical protein
VVVVVGRAVVVVVVGAAVVVVVGRAVVVVVVGAAVVVVVGRAVVVVGAAVVVVVGAAVVVVVGRAVVVVAVDPLKALEIAEICADVNGTPPLLDKMLFLMLLVLEMKLLIVDADAPRTCEFANAPWQPEQSCV